MGRPRTATKILEMRGAFKRNPERKRPYEPVSTSQFPSQPPAHLSDDEKARWNEIVVAVPAGVLTGADIFTVELAAVLLNGFRLERRKMLPALLTRLSTELGKLGLSPSDRAKLRVEPRKRNKFDDV